MTMETATPARRPLSIGRWIFLLLGFILVPMTASVLTIAYRDYRDAVDEARARQADLTRQTALAVAGAVDGAKGLALRLAERPALRALDPGSCGPALDGFVFRQPYLNNIVTTNRQGQIVCSAVAPTGPDPIHVDTRYYLNQVMETGQVVVSNAIRGVISGAWIAVVAQPLFDQEGKLAGAVQVSFSLRQLARIPQFPAEGGAVQALVVDGEDVLAATNWFPERNLGINLADLPLVRRLVGPRYGTTEGEGADHVQRLWGAAPIEGTRWRVLVGTDVAEALAGPRRTLAVDILLVVAAILAATLGTVVVCGRIVGPARALAAAAALPASGDTARLPTSGPAELQTVAAEFNQTLDRIARQVRLLRQNESRFQQIVATVPGMVFQWYQRRDGGHGYNYVSPRCFEMFGVSADALLANPDAIRISREDGQRVRRAMAEAIETLQPFAFEGRWRTPDGREFWVRTQAMPMRLDDETTVLNGIAFNITDERTRQRDMQLSEFVFQNATEAIMVTDAVLRTIRVNPAFTIITGYAPEEILGQTPRLLSSGLQDDNFYRDMWASLTESGQWSGEIWNKRRSGKIFPEWLSINVIRDEDGNPQNYLGIFSDITERKAAAERIEELAFRDPLTGLANRTLLRERLGHELEAAKMKREHLAVLVFDLDHFKNINDALGHVIGDKVLVTIAERLKNAVRDVDLVARLGGDEFAVVLTGLYRPESAAVVAEHAITSLSHAISIDGHDCAVTCSIGIAAGPEHGDTVTELLKNADAALHRAKQNGRNKFVFFNKEFADQAQRRMELTSALRSAISANDFVLHWQPQVDLTTGALNGLEVLVRWRSSGGGIVPPAEFIPLAEETGLILPIGKWVMENACRQIAEWRAAGLDAPLVGINVSGIQIARADVARELRGIMTRHHVPAMAIEVELTESTLMVDDAETRHKIDRLIDLGVKLAIDDFGTGYSSLAYLRRLTVDRLKIDRAFVCDLDTDPESHAIVRAIVGIARELGISTIAEGIETEGQAEILRRLGVRSGQGYLWSRPLASAEVTRILNGERGVDRGEAG